MGEAVLTFNGLDAETGSYLTPPMPLERLADVAAKASDSALLVEQRERHLRATEPTLAPRYGVDPKELGQTGWAILFHAGEDPAVIAALQPLIDHRRGQVQDERRLRVLTAEQGYRAGESKIDYLLRVGASPTGEADPARMPFYIVLVGDPGAIPFEFQYQLDVEYAVGRIHFDQVVGYEAYARSVVEAETRTRAGPLNVALYGTRHDPATELSATKLIEPVAEALRTSHPGVHLDDRSIGSQATKARLAALTGGADTPDLLFAAAHGLACPAGSPEQRDRQGSLVCQDWPGPGSRVTEGQAFGATDVHDTADVLGLIAFFFACFGAGTPRYDAFAHLSGGQQVELAREPFVSALTKRLLGHPAGGALAVVGHVDRAWGYSFVWDGQSAFTAVYEDAFRKLLDGYPVGSALEGLSSRHAELAVDLEALQKLVGERRVDRNQLAGLWTAKNDAQNFVLLGDPAVRLATPSARAAL